MESKRWMSAWFRGMLFFFVISFNTGVSPGICYDNVHLGIRISSPVTGPQLSFLNARYDFVMTEFLGDDVRAMFQGPELFLYRSIQDTWTGFSQFDWNHINACENMFCHYQGERIKTIFDSWLMNGSDLVAATSADALSHWVNYYAVTASEQVHTYNYDGLFIDCASHRLWPGTVYFKMPDGYSDENWRDARYTALAFIKAYFPDKPVVFNGLHSGNGAERSLGVTDGGMWETFAFRINDGTYYGERKWLEVMNLAETYGRGKFICIVSKKAGFTTDVSSRMFVFASYLLVSHPKVILYLSDLNYDTKAILYYPEYEIDLGAPIESYHENKGIYERKFEKGKVLVNPSASETRTYLLDIPCNKVIPVGGGVVREDGEGRGTLTYQPVSGKITLPPVSGVVLRKIKGTD